MQQQRSIAWLFSFLALGLARPVAAVPTAPAYDVSFVELSAPAAGDVVVVEGALFVGTGAFGVGNQTVVRIDGSGETPLAVGFNSLAGLAWNAARGSLMAGDNGGNGPGAVTGDTVYEIPSPLASPTAPARAVDLELLPTGSVPALADVVVDPADASGSTLYVSDASDAFPPAGLVLSADVATGTAGVLLDGLDFAAGLALDGDQLFVGEALNDFSGAISVLDLTDPESGLDPLAVLPGGLLDLELAPDGSLVATSGSSVVGVDPTTGETTILASGFGFAAGLFVDDGGTLFVLDGFAAPGEENRVWVLTPVPESGSAVALGLGLAALAAVRTQTRRRRACSRPLDGASARPTEAEFYVPSST